MREIINVDSSGFIRAHSRIKEQAIKNTDDAAIQQFMNSMTKAIAGFDRYIRSERIKRGLRRRKAAQKQSK